MADDISVLMGDTPRVRAGDQLEKLVRRSRNYSTQSTTDEVVDGVTAEWLARVFDVPVHKTRARLVQCSPCRVVGTTRYYRLADVHNYVHPPTDRELDWFTRNIKPEQLPEKVRSSFWIAKIKRLAYLNAAGQVFSADAVRTLFVGVFKTLRTTVEMWVDTVAENAEMTTEQRTILDQCVAGLLRDMHVNVTGFLASQKTQPLAADEDIDIAA